MPDAAATVRARLFAMQDKQYQTFQQKLLPTLPPGAVIGVRTPALRDTVRMGSRGRSHIQ